MANHPPNPLRDLRYGIGQQTPTYLTNGVTAATGVDGGLRQDLPPTAQSVTADQGDRDQVSRQIPPSGGTVMYEPSGTREETGFVPSSASVSGLGRDRETMNDVLLFPRFMPSPLPGQSPMSGQSSTPARATAWLSKIGDYLQKTVEVTSRASQGAVFQAYGGPGAVPEGTSVPLMTGTMTAGPMAAVAEHRPPSLSGSAGISPELVQAEVARQLESAMGELHEQLRAEKRRTDEAMREEQGLRRQLDVQEMRMALEHGCPQEMQPPPGHNLLVHELSSKASLVGVAQVVRIVPGMMGVSLKADRPETVKPGITDLPLLPEYAPTTGSIDLLNWLTHIQPIMQDLSDTSYAWWEGTLQDALNWYAKYSGASPLERLQLKPISSQALGRPEWARVERRATAMMLSAVPQAVREEVIAMGSVTSLALLCKLYAVYQPGNLQEKALVLQRLERPDECDTALQAVEALRKWTLWRRRAASIGIAEPDASVLIQGLDRITTKVVKANSELSFRVSLIRSTLQVDVCPSSQSVTTFLQHLQAEMEQQARLGAALPSTGGPAALRALGTSDQAMQPPSTPTSPNAQTPPRPSNGLCRFFQGEKGCRRGNNCRYPHTWSLLEKGARSKKCLACGSTAHKVKECRAPGGALAKAATRSTTTGAGETGSTSPTASSPDAHQRKVNFEDDGVIQTKVLKMLSDVQEMPLFKSVAERIREWGSSGFRWTPRSRKALLDSGSTHVLRTPRTQEEWNDARGVTVQLAGDSTADMRQTTSGSLLTGDQLAQVIVPLGKVITTLGYKLSWTSEACELIGPQGDVLPLDVKNGCPEVSEKVANKLIQQLEEQQVSQLDDTTQLSAKVLTRLKASWWSDMCEYVKGGSREAALSAIDKAFFLDFKDELKDQMVTSVPRVGIWELMKQLRVNRRCRKRLLRADAWVLRWDPPAVERHRDSMKHLSYIGDMIYVNMNVLWIENEFTDVWKVIQWAVLNGKIGTIIARDALPTHLDQCVAGPHRSKVHFLNLRGDMVRLHVEDLDRAVRWKDPLQQQQGACWPPWTCCKDALEYMDEMNLVGVSSGGFDGGRQLRLAKLSSDAAWRLHVAQNHQPFRRDCSVCVRNSATGHQHRSTMHPMAYCLSVDVVGPLKGYGRSPDGKFFKYFVIGALRIPKVEGAHGHAEVRGHPIPPFEEEAEEELILDDDEGDHGDLGEGAGAIAAEVEDEEKKWADLKTTFKEPIATTTLYFAVPVNNKKAATMLPAVQRIVTDIKALGFPITRLHSDRGGEFRGNLVRKWALSQGMWATTTSGSDSAANGVAESGVRFLKRRARVLLDVAEVGKDNWPTAVQYAAAQQRSDQLGTVPMMPVAYGTKVYVKTKPYKTGAVEDFGPHWTRGRYVGPSTDIRGGHVILKETGTFIQTTHVRVTRDPPPLDEVASVIVEPEPNEDPPEAEPPLPPPSDPPPKRMRSKGPMVAKLDGGFEDYEWIPGDLSEVHAYVEEEDPQVKYLRAEEIKYVESVAKQLCEGDHYGESHGARLLGLFAGTCGNLRVPRAPEGAGLVMGAYVHGGAFGITRYGRDLPWTARYFNNYLMKKIKKNWPDMEFSWTTLVVQSAQEVPKHKDSHNEKGTYNYVIELKTETAEGLWVQNCGYERQVVGGSEAKDYDFEELDGELVEGCLVNVKKKPAVFDPRVPHAYVNEPRPKWFLTAYTPQGAYKLNMVDQT
ncbi:unnamed protein product [Symbiodinium sp. CCMP2592]|nr:unnamed protein product [Symbiodinium sp. CCMP2592]